MSTLGGSGVQPNIGRAEAADAVYASLKKDITNFAFKPGERLVETHLSDRYGISRTPVREALRRLEQEGLVKARSTGGRFVPDFDVSEYRDLYEMRLVLEGLAVRQACERVSVTELHQLRTGWEGGFEDEVPLDGSYVEANDRFHAGLVALSRNKLLCETLGRIRDRLRIITMVDFTTEDRIKTTRHEHSEILDAVEAGDQKLASELAWNHIAQSRDSIQELVYKALGRIYDSSY